MLRSAERPVLNGYWNVAEINLEFPKPEHEALMEVVALNGTIVNHHAGRILNPGDALEFAWFMMHSGTLRNNNVKVLLACKN